MVVDKQSVIEDITILGRGIVSDVGIRETDSTFISYLTEKPFNVVATT